jgi:hypothetical protein
MAGLDLFEMAEDTCDVALETGEVCGAHVGYGIRALHLRRCDDHADGRGRCADCPHENYLTVSIRLHQHSCAHCGAVFVDARREKRYFGRGPQ